MKIIRDIVSSMPPGAWAVGAPSRPAATSDQLLVQNDRTIASLNGFGIGRGDRLAIVLDNGPEMAAAFLSCASACTTAPLNPAYREDEFAFYLEDLKAKA